MELKVQSPLGLELGVFKHACHIPAVNVVAEENMYWRDFAVSFAIIGESHRILVFRQTELIHAEVLACIPLIPKDCDHFHSFRDGLPHEWTESNLQMSVEFVQNQLPIPELPHQLEVIFPETLGRLPFTRIEWELPTLEGDLVWRTIHIYPTSPTEFTSVISQTNMNLS